MQRRHIYHSLYAEQSDVAATDALRTVTELSIDFFFFIMVFVQSTTAPGQ